MSRIRRAYENQFRELLGLYGARDRQKGVELLFAKAAQRTGGGRSDLSRGLAEEKLRLVAGLRRRRTGPRSEPPRVICDAGLGGLARWLRAAGCETVWMQDVDDGELVREAERQGAVIITTDSLLLDRRVITSGQVRAIWVPPTLTKLEQLRLVRAELNLPEGDSRCMKCGGELTEAGKEEVKDRIPPRTYRWVDEYYLCAKCGKLYWHGTHWEKIQGRLAESAEPKRSASAL